MDVDGTHRRGEGEGEGEGEGRVDSFSRSFTPVLRSNASDVS